MKKLLLVLGILSIIACVLSLLLAAWLRHSYYNVQDGSQTLYDRLQRRMVIWFVAGIILAVIGAVCLFARTKI